MLFLLNTSMAYISAIKCQRRLELTERHQYLHKPPRFSVSFILKLKKAMVETLAAAESQPKRKTQRRCGCRLEADRANGVFRN